LRFVGRKFGSDEKVRRGLRLEKFLSIVREVSVPNVKIAATVQTAAIGSPHDPHLSTTLGSVESCRCSAHIQEDFLRNVFGFRVIAYDSKRDAEDQPLVTIEQNGHGVAVTRSEMLHDSIVGKSAELGISQPARLPNLIAV